MAFVRLIWLECDNCEDNTHSTSERHRCGTRAEAIKLARTFGWVLRDKKVFCDECK